MTKAKPTKASADTPASNSGKTNEQAAREQLSESIPDWADLTKPEQDAAVASMLKVWDAKIPVRLKLVEEDGGVISYKMLGKSHDADWLRLQSGLASITSDPITARLAELYRYLGSVGLATDEHLNAALTFIQSMEPRDQAEVMLLAQMYCTHDASMRALAHLGGAKYVPNTVALGNLAAKLLRVSQGQMETLAKMRRGGVQEVRHTHYYVDNRGGQAVFTDNVQTGAKNPNEHEQSQERQIVDQCAALPSPDPLGHAVPLPCAKGPEAVPAPRREQSGGTGG